MDRSTVWNNIEDQLVENLNNTKLIRPNIHIQNILLTTTECISSSAHEHSPE